MENIKITASAYRAMRNRAMCTIEAARRVRPFTAVNVQLHVALRTR